MTAPRTAEINGRQVRLNECDWVLWSPCGCPRGVTMARYSPTEDQAWKAFFDDWRGVAKAMQATPGLRLELMTHARYSAEVYKGMLAGCPHQSGSAA